MFINPVTVKKVTIVGKDHSEVFHNIRFTNGFHLNKKKLSGDMIGWEQEYRKLDKRAWYISEYEKMMSSKC